MELTTAVDWFGTVAGVLGVTLAVYLQLINPRRCHPGHVTTLFVAGAALIMVFAAAWNPHEAAVQAMKIGAILLFVTLEAVGSYYVWKRATIGPPSEAIRALFSPGGRHG